MADIRTQKTKERIHQGLLHLLQTTPITQLTTNDILEVAEVSRKTFYTYYKDKQALLSEISDEIIADLRAALKQDRQVLAEQEHTLSQQEIYSLAQASFAETVRTVEAHRAALRVLLSQNGDPRVVRLIHQVAMQEYLARCDYLFNLTTPPMALPKVAVNLPMDYITEDYVGSLTAIIVHWVRDPHPISAHKMMSALGYAQIMSPMQLVYVAGQNHPRPRSKQ